MDEKMEKELFKIFGVAKIVAIAILGSLFLYAGMIEFVLRSGMAEKIITQSDAVGGIRNLSYIAVIGGYVLAEFMKRKMMAPKTISTFVPVMQNLYVKSVIIFVICEIPVMMGLVLFFFTGSRMDFYTYLLLTALMMIIYFPKFHEWKTTVETFVTKS